MRQRVALLIGVVALLVCVSAPDASAASKRIRPSAHAGSVTIQIGGKSSSYQKATKQKPIEFRMKGPSSVRLLSRYLFAPTSSRGEKVAYQLAVEIDEATLPTTIEKASVSSQAWLEGGGRVGTLERTIVRIPAGDHKVRVYPLEMGAAVAMRILPGTGKRAKTTWVPFAPETHAGALRLHSGDREYTYYRLNDAEAIRMTIHGPLRMKITTRLDFGAANGYTQAYVIQAFLDGELWKTFPLESRASHTSSYPEFPEVAPGRGRLVELEVPNGTHEVSITLNGTTATGAALRIRVPKRELGAG